MVRQTLAALVRIVYVIVIILTSTRCVILLRFLGLALKDPRSSLLDHLGHRKLICRRCRRNRGFGKVLMFTRRALKNQLRSVADGLDYFKTAHGRVGKLD